MLRKQIRYCALIQAEIRLRNIKSLNLTQLSYNIQIYRQKFKKCSTILGQLFILHIRNLNVSINYVTNVRVAIFSQYRRCII